MDLNAAVGQVLKGEYKKRNLRLEDVASVAGIPYSTLRKKIAGESPIFASEVVVLVESIGRISGHYVRDGAARVVNEATALYGGVDKLMSEVGSTTDELDTKRKQREAARMPVVTLEEQQRAATIDPELDTNEPEAP